MYDATFSVEFCVVAPDHFSVAENFGMKNEEFTGIRGNALIAEPVRQQM
jgi:hypothetical protein